MTNSTPRRDRFRWLAVAAALALWLAPAAARAEVKDGANVFAKAAVEAADKSITATDDKVHKDLVVETFAAIPDDRKAEFEKKGHAAFYRDWMAARAKALKVNGVYVLVCMDPKHVEVGVGVNTTKRGLFTHENAKQLSKALVDSFRGGKYDHGLAEAVAYVDRTYAANATGGDPAAANPPETADDGDAAVEPAAEPTTRPAAPATRPTP